MDTHKKDSTRSRQRGTPHDQGYKLLFSFPDLVKDLIRGFLPDPWLQGLYLDTLERQPGHYVSDDLRERADDIIWRVKVNEDWLYLYLLIEFQSSVDPFMAVRVMTYAGLLYQDLIRRNKWGVRWLEQGGRLPPILPIVLYNGNADWIAARDIADLLPADVPPILQPYLPSMRYWLFSEKELSTSPLLASMHNLLACIIRVEYPVGGDEALTEALADLRQQLHERGNMELGKGVLSWLFHALGIRASLEKDFEKLDTVEEMEMALDQYMVEWKQRLLAQGMEKGLQEGLQQQSVRLLLTILNERFGELSPELSDRVRTTDADTLDIWFRRAITAQSLEEVFNHRH
jgi:hypothetical protein